MIHRSSAAEWTSAFGTIMASAVALWLALRKPRSRVEVLAHPDWHQYEDRPPTRMVLVTRNMGRDPVGVISLVLFVGPRRSAHIRVLGGRGASLHHGEVQVDRFDGAEILEPLTLRYRRSRWAGPR